MTQTITDTGGTYLVLRVAAAPDFGEGGTDDARWCAHICDPDNLAGIHLALTTTTPYEAEWLAAAVANHAA
jgi:hypothetical protein